MPTTVVTGAAGRLGGGIAAALRRRGHRLIGVDIVQPPAEAAGTFHDFFTCDLSAAAVPDSPAGTALPSAKLQSRYIIVNITGIMIIMGE